jgi:hypothetical protein
VTNTSTDPLPESSSMSEHVERNEAPVRRWPLALFGVSLYVGLTAIQLLLSLRHTAGAFVYAQDDPYIHLAIARTLADYGVWGISPVEFASASSSPLWTVVLASFWAAGLRAVWLPFALNLVLGCVLVMETVRTLSVWRVGGGLPGRFDFALLGAVILATPLSTLAFIGMEHTLQALLVLIFARQIASRLAGDTGDGLAWACLTAALMCATRYESLFLVAVAWTALTRKGQWRAATAIAVASAAPLIVFAAYSVSNGGLILPNSVLMKSGPGRFETVGAGISAVLADWFAVRTLFVRPPELVLTIGVLMGLLLIPGSRITTTAREVWFAVLFLGTTALHACLVKLEWFFRYEAYLIPFGLLAGAGLVRLIEWPMGRATKRRQPLHPALVPLLVLLSVPLLVRALSAAGTTAVAVRNVFDQQIQMGRFFAKHYAGRPIAVNDLGAVAFMSSSPILDVVGLASQPVADLKRRRALNAESLGRLADERQVEAIAIYEDVFVSALPPSWVKVGEWTIPDNVAVSDPTVAFFARDQSGASDLRRALDAYAPELPAGVLWVPDVPRLPVRLNLRR